MSGKRLPRKCKFYEKGFCIHRTAPFLYDCDRRLIETCRHYEEKSRSPETTESRFDNSDLLNGK